MIFQLLMMYSDNIVIVNDSVALANAHIDNAAFEQLSQRVDGILNILDVSYSAVSTQLGVLNTILMIASAFLVIASVAVSYYVSHILSKTQKAKSEVEDAYSKTLILKERIDNSISGLYERLKREETVSYLKRLERVPLDINNLIGILLSRDLHPDDFCLLRNSFFKMLKESKPEDISGGFVSPGADQSYLLLFFQHFAGKSVSDIDIWPKLKGNLGNSFQAAFKNDIEKSLNDVAAVLKDNTLKVERTEILAEFIRAFRNSKFKDEHQILNEFKSTINDESLWIRAEDMVAKIDGKDEINVQNQGDSSLHSEGDKPIISGQ